MVVALATGARQGTDNERISKFGCCLSGCDRRIFKIQGSEDGPGLDPHACLPQSEPCRSA